MNVRRIIISKAALILAMGMVVFCTISCDDTVTIRYRQLGNFGLFDTNYGGSPHTTVQTQNGVFVIYCITAIENNEKNAKNFEFKLSKIRAGSDKGPGVSIADPYLKTAPNTQLIEAGNTEFVGRFVIDAGSGTPDIPNGGNKYNYYLTYKSASGESVLLIHENAGDDYYWPPDGPAPKYGVLHPGLVNIPQLTCSP